MPSGTECPAEFTGQMPYAIDCRQFINCWKGKGTIQSCAPGTLFNPKSLECDYPSKVKCKPFTGFGGSARFTEFNENADNINSLSGRGQVKCAHVATGLFEHPFDCAKFLNCVNGATFIQDCGPGTVFNALTKVCDWPANVDCGARSGRSGSHGNGNVDQYAHHGEGLLDERMDETSMGGVNGARQYQSGNSNGGYAQNRAAYGRTENANDFAADDNTFIHPIHPIY